MIKSIYNGLVGVGSTRGTVSLYSPNSGEPVVKVLAHNGHVNSFDFTQDGNYLITAGSDHQMKVFDIRNTFKEVYSYFTQREPTTLRVSQTGLVGVSYSDTILFWKDCYKEKQKSPYLKHEDKSNAKIKDFQFTPYEDFVGMTFNQKFETIFIPGSSSPDYDTFEDNIARVGKQLREHNVKRLLEKVS
jgi:U3 small nucleolar RNA-associated protein 7